MALFICLQAAPLRCETFTFAVGEWPPYIGSRSPGLGTHAQTVKRVLERAGHNVRINFLPWLRTLEMTRNGSYPATFSWVYTSERAEDFYYSTLSIDKIRYVHFYRKETFPNGLPPLDFDGLAHRDLTVVAVKNYWYQKSLEDAGVKVQFVVTEEQAWNMLRHKRADVYIESLEVGMIQKEEFLGEDAGMIDHSQPFRTVPMFILFSKSHPDGKRLKEIWETHAAQVN
ncbi:substrate-binding periplasmic protein [Roseibium sp. M-1]